MIPCTKYVPQGPSYDNLDLDEKICATTGAASRADYIDGDTHLAVNFKYNTELPPNY